MQFKKLLLAAATSTICATAFADIPQYDISSRLLTIPEVYVTTRIFGEPSPLGTFKADLEFDPGINGFVIKGAEQLEDGTGKTVIGNDANSTENFLIQPTDDALAGGGRNQSLNFGDVLEGSFSADILIGGLGIDVLLAGGGDDVIIGGTEDFNPENRDRAFGNSGNDTFIWAPGDGSDFFDGGAGDQDVLIFGLLGENGANAPVFGVEQDQNFDGIYINESTGLPIADVTNSPGFCTILDKSVYASELDALNLDQLVRFSIRGIADAFDANEQSDDNGLRVTLHVKNVEYVVCTARQGGVIEVWDISTAPATPAQITDLPAKVQSMIQ